MFGRNFVGIGRRTAGAIRSSGRIALIRAFGHF
jgi:hypothetical protein